MWSAALEGEECLTRRPGSTRPSLAEFRDPRPFRLTVVVGCLSGLAAVGFHLSIDLLTVHVLDPAGQAAGAAPAADPAAARLRGPDRRPAARPGPAAAVGAPGGRRCAAPRFARLDGRTGHAHRSAPTPVLANRSATSRHGSRPRACGRLLSSTTRDGCTALFGRRELASARTAGLVIADVARGDVVTVLADQSLDPGAAEAGTALGSSGTRR